MIRINLLPQKTSPKEIKGRRLFLAGVGILSLTVVLMVVHYYTTVDRTQITKYRKEAARYRQLISKMPKLKKIPKDKIKELEKEYNTKEAAVRRIESVRSNPVFALLELSRILSIGKGPTVDPAKAKLSLELDANWDPTGVWLTQIKEQNRVAEIAGFARTNHDVSEFAKRLNVSAYFINPTILETREVEDKKGGRKAVFSKVAFKLRVRMVY